jgi:transposase
MKISAVGVDLAKHVFQVHGVDEAGSVVLRRRLRRSEILAFSARLGPTLVGMEAVRRRITGRVSSESWATP